MPVAAASELDTLYRAHAGWLLGWLSARSRCHSRANDLAQETFSRLAEQPELRLHSHPRRYLATVARRLLIDDNRRQETERCFLDAYARHMTGSAAPSPDQIAEAVEQLQLLSDILAELPAKPRAAFLMSRIDGLTYAEIAAELGVSSSMVKQYIARAHLHCYMLAHGSPN